MEGGYDSRNGSILSQSYMHGVQRLSGNTNTSEQTYENTEEIIKSREKSWSWLFNKFSKIPDIGLLNILTLELDTESNGSGSSEVRLPVRKSSAQLQYWIDTGDTPWRAMEMEGNDTDEYVSLSESETADPEQSESLHSTSMVVNQKMANSREHFTATGSSNSSVDTATYIRENGKSGKKKDKDGLRNLDNNRDDNIVGRSINAAAPKALPVSAEAAHVDKDKEPRVSVEDEIVPSKNIADKIELQGLEKTSKNYELKESEVTFESKESGIGSLGIENTENGKGKEGKKSSSSSEELILDVNRTVSNGRRKLFTRNDALFDVLSPMVKTKRRVSSIRSFHPALDSPSTAKKFKAKIGPRLLTMQRRKSRNYSCLKRNKNKSILSKSKVLKNNRQSRGKDTKAADSTGTGTSPVDKKNPETVDADGEEKSNKLVSQTEQISAKTSALNSNKNNKEGNLSTSKSPGDSSSSLSSKDVSLIMNEKRNKASKTPVAVVQKKNQQSSVEDVRRSGNNDNANDQGSIFKQLADSSSETKASRMRSMRHVRKNLCATDLRSSEDTDSLTASNSDLLTKSYEDTISNASTILLPRARRRSKRLSSSKDTVIIERSRDSTESEPIVVLHDFLDLKSCCGELERENNEKWLRKEKKNEILESDKPRVDIDKISPRINIDEDENANEKLNEEMNRKVSEKKKRKLEKKVAASKHERKTFYTRNYDSNSSEEKVLFVRIERLDENRDYRMKRGSKCPQDVEPKGKLPSGEDSTITFINTNSNRWESLFVLSSSDEEDSFKKLSDTLKPRASRKRRSNDREEMEASIGVAKNVTIDDCGGVKLTKTIQDSYEIVHSSSEDETKTVSGTGARREKVAKKYMTRNKREDSGESEQTTITREDECGDRSESLKIGNEKSEKQSLGVNRRSERKRGKQGSETRGEYRVAQRKVNNETRTSRKSRVERDRRNGDKHEVKNSLGRKDGGSVRSPEVINDKENSSVEISGNLITPVDRVANSERKQALIDKSKTSLKLKLFNKIRRAAESSDSDDQSEVGRVPDFRDRRKSDEISRRDEDEVSSAFNLVPNDESSDNDDALTFLTSNNAGNNSRGEIILGKNTRGTNLTICSRKDPAITNKRVNNLKSDGRLSSKRKSRRRHVDSKIVFQTKEHWESDSDHF